MAKKRSATDTGPFQLPLPILAGGPIAQRAGALQRKEAVREALTRALDACPLSREDVAREVSRLTGEAISLNHIHNWCSGAKREWRFPLELVTAFCAVTRDWGLVAAILDGTDLSLAGETERHLAEFGRLVLDERRRAGKKRKLLERLEKMT